MANTYLLSRRETEIMFWRRAQRRVHPGKALHFEGTAKTHIRHVYKKTNVHSQQELMRLVELADPPNSELASPIAARGLRGRRKSRVPCDLGRPQARSHDPDTLARLHGVPPLAAV
ncbi:MAG: hypothetical protein ACLTMP_04600 [Eggerthella lenta]